MMNSINESNYATFVSTEIIGSREIKVTVCVPVKVKNRQEKINQIYDVLKPHHDLQSEKIIKSA